MYRLVTGFDGQVVQADKEPKVDFHYHKYRHKEFLNLLSFVLSAVGLNKFLYVQFIA